MLNFFSKDSFWDPAYLVPLDQSENCIIKLEATIMKWYVKQGENLYLDLGGKT
jgi:hypothetical protein